MNLIDKFIVLVSFDKIKNADAIIYLEGDGYNRLDKVFELYNNGHANKIVFSGGIEDLNYGSYPGDKIIPLLIKKGVKKSDIILEDKSLHTGEQAINVIELCEKKKWKRILLVASHYHQFRAFLTFFNVLHDKNMHRVLDIINVPVRNLSWFEVNPWGTRFEILETEFNKMYKYISKDLDNHFYNIIEYYKWKETLV